jgi:mono/diheme cytochrome c family protein
VVRRPNAERFGRARLAPLVAGLAVATALVVGHGTTAGATTETLEARLDRGAALYAQHCATCHGASGDGFAEARLAFPADHVRCERCHVPRNPPVLTPAEMRARETAFSLGDPPPLDGVLRFGSVASLRAYVTASMPRWSPGRLDDDAYDAIALHLWVRAGGAIAE